MIKNSDQYNILVSGATDRQGKAVARCLLKEGWRVKALTRNPEQPSALALKEIGAEIVRGDLGDPVSLKAAMENVYGVFSVQVTWGQDAEVEVRQG